MYIYLSTVYIHRQSHLYLKTILQHNCQMVGNYISLLISLSISLSFCLSVSLLPCEWCGRPISRSPSYFRHHAASFPPWLTLRSSRGGEVEEGLMIFSVPGFTLLPPPTVAPSCRLIGVFSLLVRFPYTQVPIFLVLSS